jgi:hypothetical protein
MVTGVAVAAALVTLGWLTTPEPAAARSRHRSNDAPVAATAAKAFTKPQGADAATQVPLPEPRPAAAPAHAAAEAAKGNENGKDGPGKGDGKVDGKSDGKADGKAEAKEQAAPLPPSACRLALTDEIAIAPTVPSISGPGECGGEDLVRLEAVVLPNKKRVALTPAGIMRCTMATAVVNWIRDDVAPEVAKLGSEIATLDNFDSYQCRGRNGDSSAHLSEHGHANAIDVHGFKLADGRMIDLTDRTQPRDFRENLLHSACTRFSTVLGPDSDWHHEDHIHVDAIERRNNYRICQWDVLDPLPKVAPLLPEVRPDDAPSREIVDAEKDDKAKDQADIKANGAAKVNDGRSGNDKAAGDGPRDAKASEKGRVDDKPAPAKPVTETRDAPAATAKPASPARTPEKAAAAAAATEKPESKPVAEPIAPAKTSTDAAAANKPAGTKVSAGKAARDKAASDKAAADKAASDKAAADKAASDKAAIDKAASDKAASDKVASDKASSDKAATDNPPSDKANDKTSRKKLSAEKAAPKKRRQRERAWNPFAGFF